MNYPVLSITEQERHRRFSNKDDSIRYICNHRFMHNVLADYLNIDPCKIIFEVGPFGKPFIKEDIYFNLSYRNKYGLLALSADDEVGVDIEQLIEIGDVLSFISLYFSEKEIEVILKADYKNQIKNIFLFWTLKEALIKAQGKGLSTDLCKIDLVEGIQANSFIFKNEDEHLYSAKNIMAKNGYFAAIAIKGNISQYKEFGYEQIQSGQHLRPQ